MTKIDRLFRFFIWILAGIFSPELPNFLTCDSVTLTIILPIKQSVSAGCPTHRKYRKHGILNPDYHVTNITIAELILIVHHWLNANFSHSSWNQIKKCWIWIPIFCCNDFHFFLFQLDRKPKLGIGDFISASTAFKVFSKANFGSLMSHSRYVPWMVYVA